MDKLIKFLTGFILLLLLFFAPLADAKDRGEFLYNEAFRLYKSLASDPEKSDNKEIWNVLGEAFYSVYVSYPNSNKASNALFLAGRTYEEIGKKFNSFEDYDKATIYSRLFVKNYPESNLTDDAQIRVARIAETRGRKSDAYLEYQKIIKEIPKDDMYDIAKRKVVELSSFKPSKKALSKASLSGLARITKIRHWSTDNYTRVVIHLDKELPFKSNLLNADPKYGKPPRLYVDIDGADIDNTLYVEPITKGLLEEIKFGRNQPDVSRVVLYINSFENYRVFALPNPYRIVMDIEGRGADPDTLFAKDPNQKKTKPKYTPKDSPSTENIESLRQALGLKIKTVVIDAGHGGHDPGAIGPSGLKEKDVNLKIAKRLQEKLLADGKQFGIENVYLTRSSDRFIPLEERTAIAKKRNADLFISIHCNAAKDKRAYGIETYILSFTNDKSSLEVAARENATTTKGISDLKDIVQKYLLSSKIEESKKFAGYVQGSIISKISSKYSPVKNKGVKKAPFIVLIGADIPSILIETSFITNPTEEKRLKSSSYIDRIANGIIAGIRQYADETKTAFIIPENEYKL